MYLEQNGRPFEIVSLMSLLLCVDFDKLILYNVITLSYFHKDAYVLLILLRTCVLLLQLYSIFSKHV